MKKFTVYFLLVAVLAMSLCGCGNDSMGNDTSIIPSAAPTASPNTGSDTGSGHTGSGSGGSGNTGSGSAGYSTPNVEDGAVNDRDGIIEESDNGGASSPSASPETSPTAGAKS